MTTSKHTTADVPQARDAATRERSYEPPQIITLGTLAELTLGGHGHSMDGTNMHASSN